MTNKEADINNKENIDNETVIVYPGQELDKSFYGAQGTYQVNNKVYSSVVGMLRKNKIIILQGSYNPFRGDKIIGIVNGECFSGYNLMINMTFEASLSARELRDRLHIGDIVECEVDSVDVTRKVTVKNAHKLGHGTVIFVPPVKVPRLIGKQMSMINMIKEKTGCEIRIGKNGIIWLKLCNNINLAKITIKKVVKEAHLSGLTAKIEDFLDKQEVKKNE